MDLFSSRHCHNQGRVDQDAREAAAEETWRLIGLMQTFPDRGPDQMDITPKLKQGLGQYQGILITVTIR